MLSRIGVVTTLSALVLGLAGCSGEDAASADAAHVEAMAEEHANDAPTANESRAPAQEVVGREVTYGTVDGQPLTGYLARPASEPEGEIPGLIVIHEWWGLNDNIREMARRFAGEGYAVLAVDMYGGEVAEDPSRAQELMGQATQQPRLGERNLEAAASYLDETENAERIGIVGWCFGGGWSLRGSLAMPERIDAVVMYYGQPITDREELARLDAPLLGLFAAEDQGIPVEQVREMESTLQELGKQAEIVVFPGVDHAFANPSGGNYDAATASEAWDRAAAFFERHLKGAP